jgi:putative transposase
MGKFKNVLVKSDEQLLHLVRYVHLNAVTAHIVSKPEKWQYSSYAEYIYPDKVTFPFVQYSSLFDLSPHEHQKFTEDGIDYQRSLAVIKKLVLE